MSETEPAQPLTNGDQARHLADVVTRLRRALRTNVRSGHPWESRPMAQVELLMSLADHTPARVGKLARVLCLAPNTVSGLVQQLVDAGLAARHSDTTDRRVAVVTLTEDGQRELRACRAAHEQRIGAAMRRLTDADRAAVSAALPALDQLVDALDSH